MSTAQMTNEEARAIINNPGCHNEDTYQAAKRQLGLK